jgi:protein gp37
LGTSPNNSEAARRAVKAIRASVRVIAQHPEIGRPAEGMEPEYREWVIDFGDSGYRGLKSNGTETYAKDRQCFPLAGLAA